MILFCLPKVLDHVFPLTFILADFNYSFAQDLDLTTSDVMLGMMLLRWQSNQWIGGQTQVPAKFILDQTDPVLDDVAAPVCFQI